MNTFDCIRKRHSVRSFSDKDVSDNDIEKIVESGRAAPSAGGLQTQEFIVIRDKEKIQKIAQIAFDQDFVAQVPVVVVVLVDEKKSMSRYGQRGNFYAVCDGSAATENILLAVTDLGLASCWIGAFDDDSLKELLNTELKPIAILPVGYEK